MKTRVAVFFGGRSPEHDVSIVTGLQVLEALDQERFDAFPVYVALDGEWLLGDALRSNASYLPRGRTAATLRSVTLDLRPNVDGIGRLVPRDRTRWSAPEDVAFDVALLAFHGLAGEDGRMQGLFEIANVAYTGLRVLASGLAMDKVATKLALAGTGIPLLPSIPLERPASRFMLSADAIATKMGEVPFPAILKPGHLGSSIGVARVTNIEELRAALPAIFQLDTIAIIEPFVENLVEYNIAVRAVDGCIQTSAIERPKKVKELLDFKEKYLSGKSKKTGGSKRLGTVSQGMLSLTREINPHLPEQLESNLRTWAEICFRNVGGTGAPRIDFLSDEKTGGVWLNEVNPIPGSFGYFLWEAAPKPILFSALLSFLVDEALREHAKIQLPRDPTHPDGRLFTRG
jgi:D-alanine-D-alanine ligase